MGFLGTSASTVADINLVAQLVIVVLLATGWVYGRDKKKIKLHGQLMVVAVLVNGVAIALVMVPSLILNLGSIESNPLGPGPLVSVVHAIVGTVAWIYAAYLSWVWGLKPATVECFKRKKWMKPVLYAWLAAAILGVGFYVYYYVL
jgi:hypothetical protein